MYSGNKNDFDSTQVLVQIFVLDKKTLWKKFVLQNVCMYVQ